MWHFYYGNILNPPDETYIGTLNERNNNKEIQKQHKSIKKINIKQILATK